MSGPSSTKPYLVRALHEWCTDNGLTPHLLVVVNAQTRVPAAYVKDGEIILNLSYSATKDLVIDNDAITFSARFNGTATNLYIPMRAVRGLFAREDGQGMFFEVEEDSQNVPESPQTQDGEPAAGAADKQPKRRKPALKIVK